MTAKPEMPDELKPCPFCGGKGEPYQPCEDISVISCTQCNAESGYYMGNDSTTPDDAITFWNRRADSPSPATVEKMVGALRSIAGSTCCGTCQEAKLVAQKALAQHEAVGEK